MIRSNESMQSQVHMVPCQNKFGNNARIFGGTHGLAEALGAATENQGHFKGSDLLADPVRKEGRGNTRLIFGGSLLFLQYFHALCFAVLR